MSEVLATIAIVGGAILFVYLLFRFFAKLTSRGKRRWATARRVAEALGLSVREDMFVNPLLEGARGAGRLRIEIFPDETDPVVRFDLVGLSLGGSKWSCAHDPRIALLSPALLDQVPAGPRAVLLPVAEAAGTSTRLEWKPAGWFAREAVLIAIVDGVLYDQPEGEARVLAIVRALEGAGARWRACG